MNKDIFRLIFGCSLSLCMGVALAQDRKSDHGNSGGGQSHQSGGGDHSGGGQSHQSGGDHSGGSQSHQSGGGGDHSGGSQSHQSGGGGGGNSGGGQSHQSGGGGDRSGSGNSGGTHSGGPTGGGYSGGSSSSGGSRYGGSSRYGGGSATNQGSGSSRYGGGSSYQGSNSSRSGQGGSSSHYGSSKYGQNGTSSRTQSGPGGTSSRTSGGSRYGGSASGYGGYNNSRSGGYQDRYSGGGSTSNNIGFESGFERGHANMSRSGTVTYSGNNNRNGSGTGKTGKRGNVQERFGPPHRGLIGPSTLGKVIGDNHHGLVNGGFRTGYFGYWSGWRDSFFCFPFYVFDPWFDVCYCSPWYYYPCLPGYIAVPRVIIVDRWPSERWEGEDYDWTASGSGNVALDDGIQDLIQCFEADDHRAMDHVIPHNGTVGIFVEGKYSYSLKANDFYDTYVDGIESTKTDRYEIVEVKAGHDGMTARVVAKHVYTDPWGNRTYVYHTYFLVKEGDDFVIREFGTSDYNTGW